jgi:hypothetical protein
MMARKNPHDGRLAEVYWRGPDGLRWIGYTAEPLFDNKKARWDTSLQGWVIDETENAQATEAAQPGSEGAEIASAAAESGGVEEDLQAHPEG